ncbi:MAG: kinase [Pseudomonadota bacterium]
MNEDPASTAKLIEVRIRARLARHDVARPLLVGICGSQGSGKSTVCRYVAHSAAASGIRVAVLSIDDLYLPRQAREILALKVHPLLCTRGVPGTHEVLLGVRTLGALGASERVRIPRFDKARDDRLPQELWDTVDAPLDLILFEGWCVGATPQAAHQLDAAINTLEAQEDADGRWRHYVNDALSLEYQELFAPIDYLVLLAAPSFEIVTQWRIEQEQQLRAARPDASGVMTDAQIVHFVQHYERLTRHVLAEMPARADLVLRLDQNRRVIA